VIDKARADPAEDIFAPIEELEPEIIALGYDQHRNENIIVGELAGRREAAASHRPLTVSLANWTALLV